jgi:hypothetical protein
MDERLRVFLWIAGGGAFFAVLGAGFGGLAGALYWRGGRTAGTGLGLAVARAFDRAAGQSMSRTARGAITGAVDGFLFLGLLGLALGALAVYSGKVRPSVVGPVVVGALLLAAGALFFGGLAYAITRTGVLGVASLFAGAATGALVGFSLAGPHGLMIGLVAGVLLGSLAGLVLRRPGAPLHSPAWDQDLPEAETDLPARPEEYWEDS